MENPKPLVCIFAHPDDESFGPGGAIARFANERDVYIICVTSGDSDAKFTKHDSNGLGKVREQELLAAAEILGVKKVDFLRFKDGSLCNNNYHEVAEKIKELLEVYHPDTLMTFDFCGVSGHLDHVAVAMITAYLARDLPYVEQVLYYCELDSIIEPWRKDYFVYVPKGYKPEDTNLEVDFTEHWDKMEQAMRAHTTQFDDATHVLNEMKKHPKKQYFKVIAKPDF